MATILASRNMHFVRWMDRLVQQGMSFNYF